MKRLVQLTCNLHAAVSSAAATSRRNSLLCPNARAFSLTHHFQAKRQDNLGSSFGDKQVGGDKKRNKTNKKKGFIAMATDKLGELSGVGPFSGDKLGSKATKSRNPTISDRQTRSASKRQGEAMSSASGEVDKQGGESSFPGPADHRSINSVRHEREAHRFTLDLGNNQVARIDYKPLGGNAIELFHTEVPVELRGRGIGKTLAKGALECASRGNLKLKVTCEYLDDYVKRFADSKHKKLVQTSKRTKTQPRDEQ